MGLRVGDGAALRPRPSLAVALAMALAVGATPIAEWIGPDPEPARTPMIASTPTARSTSRRGGVRAVRRVTVRLYGVRPGPPDAGQRGSGEAHEVPWSKLEVQASSATADEDRRFVEGTGLDNRG